MKSLNLSKSFLASLSVSLFLLTAPLAQIKAVETPSFPACSNPQGTLSVDYPSGTHGIAGNSAEFTGSDKVYTLSDNTLFQCFCSVDGAGIQTDWWKVSSLSEDQIEVLKKDNWILIPDGSLWGLEEAPYLAKNSNFSCKGSNNDSNNGGSSNSSSRGTGGEVLGTSISLPSTGADTVWLIFAGILLISGFGFLFKGFKKRV